MKSRQTIKLSVLRMLLSEMKNKKIADRTKELDDEMIMGLVQKMIRQHKDSIEQFKQGGRDDLAEKEAEELTILERYLPEQMTAHELESIVLEVISLEEGASIRDMGKIMKAVMIRVKGRAEGKLISDMVKQKLQV
ncbi:MAG: GatB/YqeY domain-containing protein [Candidatus Omnitrophota bacterium]